MKFYWKRWNKLKNDLICLWVKTQDRLYLNRWSIFFPCLLKSSFVYWLLTQTNQIHFGHNNFLTTSKFPLDLNERHLLSQHIQHKLKHSQITCLVCFILNSFISPIFARDEATKSLNLRQDFSLIHILCYEIYEWRIKLWLQSMSPTFADVDLMKTR
jgi:hypothetical protein